MRRLLVWLAAAFDPAAIGAAFPAPDSYADLRKPGRAPPPWLFGPGRAPPPWLFGPAWTVLYAMLGVAAWLAARRGRPGSRGARGMWGGQLVLTAWVSFATALTVAIWRLND